MDCYHHLKKNARVVKKKKDLLKQLSYSSSTLHISIVILLISLHGAAPSLCSPSYNNFFPLACLLMLPCPLLLAAGHWAIQTYSREIIFLPFPSSKHSNPTQTTFIHRLRNLGYLQHSYNKYSIKWTLKNPTKLV